MKKILLVLGSSFLLSLGALHLIVSSGPIQRRILDKIKNALLSQGIEITIESVDFSLFTPRIYLNRVTIQTNDKAAVQLENPLEIDKVKVQFQPLGLINREIVLDEVALFHPKIQIPRADQLYQKVVAQLEKKKPIEVQGKGWPLVFRRVGVIDSQFDVRAENPSFSLVSRSLTVFFSQTAQGQQTIEAKSNHLEVERGKLSLVISDLDGDVDFTEQSVRVNRLKLEGEGIKIEWKGACSLPSKGNSKITSFHLAHETDIDLTLLNQIEELGAPELSGRLKSSGTLHVGKESYSGSGQLKLTTFQIGGNQLGDLETEYALDPKDLKLSNLKALFASGQVRSSKVRVGLASTYPIETELEVVGLELNDMFRSLQIDSVPLHLGLDGRVKLSGTLSPKMNLSIEPQLKGKDLYVLNKAKLGKSQSNQILFIPAIEMQGKVGVGPTTVELNSHMNLLGGKLVLDGKIENGDGRIQFTGKDISLTQLRKISDLSFRGKSQLSGEVVLAKKDVNVEGQFEIEQSSISDLELGGVKGRVQYRGDLLSFSKLEIRALDVVRGQGHVDFAPELTQYRFDINLPRIGMEQVLKVFSKTPLPVQNPLGGEVAGRVLIQGGGDMGEMEVRVDGQARSFEWYGEKWMSASFGFQYQPDSFVVPRGVFLKRSGSLEVRAQFDKKVKQLTFFSSGLRLEDLNHLGQSPVQGEVTGRLVFEGDMSYPRGNGELNLSKLQFREKKVSDARLVMKSAGDTSEYWLSFDKETLQGHLIRKEKDQMVWSQLNMSCEATELAPYLSAWMGKDISPLNQVLVTGKWKMEGDFSRPSSMSGSAQIKNLKLGFEGRPLVSDDDIQIKIHQGGVVVPRIRLSGNGNELFSEIHIVPDQSVDIQASGKISLDFLQPFIPGLDYASGSVNANLEATGSPQRFNLFGNLSMVDSAFRITGMNDEFRNVSAQLNLSENKITFERFQGTLGGGDVSIGGEIQIGRFTQFSPNLNLFVSKVSLRPQDFLTAKLTGELLLKGKETPYRLSGSLKLDEVLLTRLAASKPPGLGLEKEVLIFDIKADAKENIFVKTDVIDAEFRGDFRLLGNTNKIGLLGKTEVIRGKVFFKDTPFDLVSGLARFERENEIYPRFNITGRSVVREQKGRAYQDYEVNLQVLGTSDDYKIRLVSNPPLVEQDLISLLVLGVTSRGQEGSYFDLGTAIMGQSPIKSKLQSELGVDIKVQSTPSQVTPGSSVGAGTPGGTGSALGGPGMVPAVRIEKGLSRRTKISYSNTLDQNQARELRLEQMLDENITLNATAGDRSRNNTQARPGDSFGLDVRYRFDFE